MSDSERAISGCTFHSVSARYGKFFLPSKSDIIANSLREYGEWAQAELDILCDFLAPGDVVIDGGACFGTHARAFSERVGASGKIICFEPADQNRAVLQRNASIAPIANIEVRSSALGARPGSAKFIVPTDNSGGSQIVSVDDTAVTDEQAIEIVRLDDVVVERVSFIKLDLERSEEAALMGAERILSEDRPVVFVEVLDVDAGSSIIRHMLKHGYLTFGVNTPAFCTDNFNNSDLDIFAGGTECGLLFIDTGSREKWEPVIAEHRLAEIKTLDDLVLLLLQQPQYSETHLASRISANGFLLPLSPMRYMKIERQLNEEQDLREQQQVLIEDLENKLKAFEEAVKSAAHVMRRPIATSIQRNLAKAALRNLPWLSERRRAKLMRSVAKRDYRILFDDLASLLSAGEPLISPSRSKIGLGQSRDFGEIAPAEAPCAAEWDALVPTGGIVAPDPVVDVIVPVFRGYAETMRCLYSVINEEQRTPFRVLVINDRSPEEELTSALRMLERRGWIVLIENESNLGFVLSCNRGMRANPERDVILLNSDTEVYSDWIDRIMARADKNPLAGSLTPLSNNATICSYPFFCKDNFQELEVNGRQLDALAAEVCGTLEPMELPTAVGFCMYLRRSCLEQVGLFDEDNFGKGYGEENDLSRRLMNKGWSNMIVPDVYVRHWGAVSFGKNNQKRLKKANATINRLYPSYHREVGDFIASDPILPVRSRLDCGRLAARARGNAILFVTHNLGGGTEKHVQYMRRWIEGEGVACVFLCRPHPTLPGNFYIEDPDCAPTPNLPLGRWTDGTRNLEQLFKSCGIRQIHVHHVIEHGSAAPGALRSLALSAALPVDFTLHDYFPVCPRINLIDGSGVYCGEPDISACQACVDRNGSRAGYRVNMMQWREKHLSLLAAVRNIYAPSHDVARRMGTYLERDDIRVREHSTDKGLTAALREPVDFRSASGGVRKVALLGAIGSHKGSDLLFQVAQAAQRFGIPLEFVVIGYTDQDRALRSLGNVEITGPYESDRVLDVIREAAPELIWISSVCPETFCFTLSEAMAAGVQPVVFDLGAQADRIRQIGWGTIMPLKLMTDPEGVARFLASCDLVPPHAAARGSLVREYMNVQEYFS